MKASATLRADHDDVGLFSRVAHEVSTAMDWLTGPAMSGLERRERLMAEVKSLRHDTSALRPY